MVDRFRKNTFSVPVEKSDCLLEGALPEGAHNAILKCCYSTKQQQVDFGKYNTLSGTVDDKVHHL